MKIEFRQADVLRAVHGATVSRLDYWARLGLIHPATSLGDRHYKILDVIDVALAVWLSTLGMSTDRMKHVFALRRRTLARVPPTHRAVHAWMQYVQMVRTGAQLIGLTDDPAFQEWEREVAIVLGRFQAAPVAPDEELLSLLTVQPFALGGATPHHAS